jgi:predicted ribosomally synthesized peptide with nif11-like leader
MNNSRDMEQFFQLVKQDGSLREELMSADSVDSFVGKVISASKLKGLELSEEDVKLAIASLSISDVLGNGEARELSDEQLLAFAGGKGGGDRPITTIEINYCNSTFDSIGCNDGRP